MEMWKELEKLRAREEWSLDDARRFNELRFRLEPYLCPICHKPAVGNDIVIHRAGALVYRFHSECWKIREERRRRFWERQREWEERMRRIREEVEAGVRPTMCVLHMIFTGRLPDFERFKEEVRRLALKYGLKPWEEVPVKGRAGS